MRSAFALVVTLMVLGVSAAPEAVARMWGTNNNNNITGLVTFTNNLDGSYTVFVNVSGFVPNSEHGIHIHTWGDITSAAGTAAGGHFNPFDVAHGCSDNTVRHVGDLGNVTADAAGVIVATLVRSGFNLTFDALAPYNNSNVIGRGVIIHAAADNCVTQPTGGSGARLAQGVIGVASNTPFPLSTGSSFAAEALQAKLYNPQGVPVGQVWMRIDPQDSAKVQVYMRAAGFVPGSVHGIHVHAWGDHTRLDGSTAGGHWDPFTKPHRLPYEGAAGDRHVGDLGNVIAGANGEIYHLASYPDLVLGGANWASSIGRGFVVHGLADQGQAIAGNGGAGARVAMGVLGIAAAFPSTIDPAFLMSGYVRLYPTVNAPAGASGSVRIVHGADNLAAITVSLTGLTAGAVYAMHIHEFGDLNSVDGTATGGHFNPFGYTHACYPATGQRHAGDIGNLPAADSNGAVSTTLYRDWIALAGQNSTIGRAIIVHAQADDCTTQPTGNAGARLMHGVIGLENNAAQNASNPSDYPLRQPSMLLAKIVGTTNAPGVSGWAWFRVNPTTGFTQLYLNITGVAPVNASHGIHVHTYGDWTNPSGTTAGGHWNPLGYTHALPTQNSLRHAGDLGNVLVDGDGKIDTFLSVDNLPLGGGAMSSIIGRGIVLHQNPDQGQVDPVAGNAGLRIGLGVIGITNQPWPFQPQPPTNGTASSTGPGCLSDGTNCNGAHSAAGSPLPLLLAAAMALAAYTAKRM